MISFYILENRKVREEEKNYFVEEKFVQTQKTYQEEKKCCREICGTQNPISPLKLPQLCKHRRR